MPNALPIRTSLNPQILPTTLNPQILPTTVPTPPTTPNATPVTTSPNTSDNDNDNDNGSAPLLNGTYDTLAAAPFAFVPDVRFSPFGCISTQKQRWEGEGEEI